MFVSIVVCVCMCRSFITGQFVVNVHSCDEWKFFGWKDNKVFPNNSHKTKRLARKTPKPSSICIMHSSYQQRQMPTVSIRKHFCCLWKWMWIAFLAVTLWLSTEIHFSLRLPKVKDNHTKSRWKNVVVNVNDQSKKNTIKKIEVYKFFEENLPSTWY